MDDAHSSHCDRLIVMIASGARRETHACGVVTTPGEAIYTG
jgi:hypothetical protein